MEIFYLGTRQDILYLKLNAAGIFLTKNCGFHHLNKDLSVGSSVQKHNRMTILAAYSSHQSRDQ